MYFQKKEKGYQIVIHSIMIFICLTYLLSFWYVINMSLASKYELIEKNYFVMFVNHPTFEAYSRLLGNARMWRSLFISFARCIVTPTTSVIISFVCAFILSHRNIPGNKIMSLFILFTMLFGAGLIPGYILMKDLKLLNNFWVYVVPGLVDVYGVFAMKTFIENIPKSMFESAEIDGASPVVIMFKIAVPLVLPSMVAIFMFSVVGNWNSWYDAYIYCQQAVDIHPFQLYLRSMLLVQIDSGMDMEGTTSITNETIQMATIVLSTIPMLILFPFMQKYFIHGVFAGAVKE